MRVGKEGVVRKGAEMFGEEELKFQKEMGESVGLRERLAETVDFGYK